MNRAVHRPVTRDPATQRESERWGGPARAHSSLQSHDAFPGFGLDSDGRTRAADQAHKSAVVRDGAIPEQPSKQSERVLRQKLVDKQLLPFQSLRCTATGVAVVIQLSINNGRVQLGDAAQTGPTTPVNLIQWLTEDELAAVRVVAEIEPIKNLAVASRRLSNERSGSSRVHATE